MRSRCKNRGIHFAILSLLLAACLPRAAAPTATPPAESAKLHAPTPVVIAVTATPPPTAMPSPTPAATRIIPRSVSGTLLLQTSLVVITATLDGRDSAGDAMAGDLIVQRLTTDSLKQSSTVLTGSLTTRTLNALLRSSELDRLLQSAVYRRVGGSYWMVQYAPRGEYSCIKIEYPDEQDPLYRDQTPFEELLQRRQPFLYGAQIGEAVVNGIAVRHYTLDAGTSNRAALASEDPMVHNSVDALKLVSGDVYLAREGDYMVRFNAEYEGDLKVYGFSGHVRLAFDLTRPAGVTGMTLPQACTAAEARANLPPTAGKAELLSFYPFYNLSDESFVKSSLSLTLRGRDPSGRTLAGGITTQYTEDTANDRKMLVMEGLGAPRLESAPEMERLAVRRVSLYVLGDDAYVLAEGQNARNTRCASVTRADHDETMRWMSPEGLMDVFVDTGTLYGVFVRDEKVNGIATRHYRLDVNATNAAAEKARNIEHILPELTGGDVYIAREGEHLVRLVAEATGPVESMRFIGRVTLQFDLSTPARAASIVLPKNCNKAQPS